MCPAGVCFAVLPGEGGPLLTKSLPAPCKAPSEIGVFFPVPDVLEALSEELPKLNDQVDKDDFGHAGRRSHGGQEAKSSMLSFIMKKRCAGGQ